MSRKKNKRASIRKPKVFNKERLGLFLYGRLKETYIAKGYCILHKCFLESKDIYEKKCKKKKCKYFNEK